MNSERTDQTRLTFEIGGPVAIWSPKGQQIAFIRTAHRLRDIHDSPSIDSPQNNIYASLTKITFIHLSEKQFFTLHCHLNGYSVS